MKKTIVVLGAALLISVVASFSSRPMPIEEKLISIQAREVLPHYDAITDESVDVQAAVLDLGDDPLTRLKAQAALLAHPEMARTILPLYASEPEFREVLRKYGEGALPPIDYFLRHPVTSIEWMDKAVRQYERVRNYFAERRDDNHDVSKNAEALTPEQRGWYAVNFIRTEGHDFLGQFLVDAAGQTQWVQTERVTEGLAQFFTSGVRQLEADYRTGEDISAADIGWASVDVLVFASAVKVLRASRAAAKATQSARFSTRSAALAARISSSGRLILNSARYAKWPLVIGAGYLVISHPSIINDFFAGVADVFGVSPMLIQLAGWLLILVPMLYLASWLLRPAIALLKGLLALLYALAGRRRPDRFYRDGSH